MQKKSRVCWKKENYFFETFLPFFIFFWRKKWSGSFHFFDRKKWREKKKLRKKRLNSNFKIEYQFWNPFWIKFIYIHKNFFKNLLFNFLLFSHWFEKRRMSFKNQTFKKNFWNTSIGILFAHTKIKCISFFSILSIKKRNSKMFLFKFLNENLSLF